jgi:hypothetical protein
MTELTEVGGNGYLGYPSYLFFRDILLFPGEETERTTNKLVRTLVYVKKRGNWGNWGNRVSDLER